MEPDLKRLIDVVLSVVFLIVLSPVLVLAALAVLVDLGSPVIFRQSRAGKDGRAFEIIKFRTMRDGPGSDAERVTRLGHWLRLTSIDELPELVNVILGDMSLVGPRPHLLSDLKGYSTRQRRRLAMRPGMTGLAQVNGRNAIGRDKKIALDLAYIRDRSIWLDLAIMAKTVPVVLIRAGRDKAAGAGLNTAPLWPRLPNPMVLFWILVEPIGIEPTTSSLRTTRSPN